MQKQINAFMQRKQPKGHQKKGTIDKSTENRTTLYQIHNPTSLLKIIQPENENL
ncbi:hypothetical protein [Bacteroides sp. 51]|uniref:hypothetical protein n=1 Tax=Bacteroides sp. 51 TaxID=2302938 RepID=UPI0013D59000|nr:hypothetical protein [Bacteroides sp. 51]